jgi:hypothetical protein
MIKEFDLSNLTNEKAEAITRLLDQQKGPTMSISTARKEFAAAQSIQLDLNVYEKIAQESSKRKRALTMTEWLELQDPSENYRPVLINGKLKFLDAFERQLIIRDIVVSGPNSVDLATGFFSNSTNRTLFPEFVNRNILAGRLQAKNRVTLSDLIAESIQIDAVTYPNLTADWADQDVSQATIGEGARFPAIVLTLGEREIQLQKFGGKIKGTYEYFRRVRANQFAVTLRFIGEKWEKDKADGAVDVILNGNTGNSNAAINTDTAVTGTVTFEDMVRWILAGEFSKDLLIVSETRAGDIILMDEFIDPNVGFNFQATGSMISPFNRTMRISDTISDDLIAAIDPEAALIEVVERGSSITETQKIMDGQFEELLFSQYIGYSKLFEEASQTLTIDW